MPDRQIDKLIEGVIIKDLVTHTDERGFFREIIKVDDDLFSEGFGQWSHSLMHQGSAKAWHIHKHQVDWWYVASGTIKVALHDKREDSPTYGETMEFFMGDNHQSKVVKIPEGVAHGCKCLSGPTHFFYITSKMYDPGDEGRIDHDDKEIGYDWEKGPDIK